MHNPGTQFEASFLAEEELLKHNSHAKICKPCLASSKPFATSFGDEIKEEMFVRG
jgi:hypothetical protein